MEQNAIISKLSMCAVLTVLFRFVQNTFLCLDFALEAYF
jgi:hypothetical protein